MCEYIYVLYSHFKHKALEMRAAEIKKPMSCFGSGAGVHRCHWQIWAEPPALLPSPPA